MKGEQMKQMGFLFLDPEQENKNHIVPEEIGTKKFFLEGEEDGAIWIVPERVESSANNTSGMDDVYYKFNKKEKTFTNTTSNENISLEDFLRKPVFTRMLKFEDDKSTE